MTFRPDGKYDDLKALRSAFLHECSVVGHLAFSTNPPPPDWDPRTTNRAIELKRQGQFLESAQIYVDESRVRGTVYAVILNNLYKTVASGGDLVGGFLLLMLGERVFAGDPKGQGVVANLADHRSRLIEAAATGSPAQLRQYLSTICGNFEYRLPREYDAMVGELNEYLQFAVRKLAELDQLTAKSKGGCYVASAVYGSYDCPEVWVLRRYRDQVLARSAPGRWFIRGYYRISPLALGLLGTRSARLFGPLVEALVGVLKARGFSDAPYVDVLPPIPAPSSLLGGSARRGP